MYVPIYQLILNLYSKWINLCELITSAAFSGIETPYKTHNQYTMSCILSLFRYLAHGNNSIHDKFSLVLWLKVLNSITLKIIQLKMFTYD